jgi:hypothetical protein
MATLEFHPNKYVANVMFLLKFWLFFLAGVVWMMIALWSAKVPDKATINAAIEFTKDEPRPWYKKIMNWIARAQAWIIAVVALPLGQWAIFIWIILFLAGLRKLKPTAQQYLSRMHIDLDKKKAVIDV